MRPAVEFPKWLRICCISGIGVLSFVPIFTLSLYLGGASGFSSTLPSILVNFEVGKNWTYTAVVCVVLLLQNLAPDLEKKKPLVILSLVYLLGLAFLVGWSSHASSLTGMSGFLLHTIHFVAITIWTGILIVVGWFSEEMKVFLLPFLKWFTPVAICCVVMAIFSGFGLMTQVVELKDYAQSWLVPYGQTILFKHLLIIPLLVFAFLNGFLLKRYRMLGEEFQIVTWLRAEGIMVFLIYFVTAILGTVAPPHDIASVVRSEGPSKLIETLYGGGGGNHRIEPNRVVSLELGVNFWIFSLLAVGSLTVMILLFFQKKSSYLAMLFGNLFVLIGYLGLMLSIK